MTRACCDFSDSASTKVGIVRSLSSGKRPATALASVFGAKKERRKVPPPLERGFEYMPVTFLVLQP